MEAEQDERKNRLADALRENLRRRKAQARLLAAADAEDRHSRESGNPDEA